MRVQTINRHNHNGHIVHAYNKTDAIGKRHIVHVYNKTDTIGNGHIVHAYNKTDTIEEIPFL